MREARIGSFTGELGLSLPTPGDPTVTNAWGTILNTNFSLLDDSIAGLLSLSVAGASNVVLTATAGAANQARLATFNLTGVLTGNIQVLWPENLSFKFAVLNSTTGAFTLSLGADNGSASAAGKTVIIPQGAMGSFASDGVNVRPAGSLPATRQVLTAGSAATYTTPAGCTQLRIRMIGGGGGSGGNGGSPGNGGTGGSTLFNAIAATGGGGSNGTDTGSNAIGGAGGTGGAGSASFRSRGAAGCSGQVTSGTAGGAFGGSGGSGQFGGGTPGGGGAVAGAANTGGGASGPNVGATGVAPGGGGSGEYVEYIINAPASSYVYTVGAGGTAGTAGSGGLAGAAGGTGVIIVDEEY